METFYIVAVTAIPFAAFVWWLYASLSNKLEEMHKQITRVHVREERDYGDLVVRVDRIETKLDKVLSTQATLLDRDEYNVIAAKLDKIEKDVQVVPAEPKKKDIPEGWNDLLEQRYQANKIRCARQCIPAPTRESFLVQTKSWEG